MKTRNQYRRENAVNHASLCSASPISTQGNDFSDSRTGFLKLSAELRNTIYMPVLADLDFEIDFDYRAIPRLVSSQPVTAQLLQTCRIIHEEAAPILYGANKLSFVQNSRFREFYSIIGRNIQFVRKVAILDPIFHFHATDMEHLRGAILDMPKLESLQLPRLRTPEEGAERYAVLLRRLYRIKGMRDRGRAIAAMIVFTKSEVIRYLDVNFVEQTEDVAYTERARKWIRENF